MRAALGIDIDHANRIGYVICHPELFAVRAQGEADGVNPNVDAVRDLGGLGVNDIYGVLGCVGHKQSALVCKDRSGVRAKEGWVTDLLGCGAQGNLKCRK